MRPEPYVGISGVMHSHEIRDILSVFETAPLPCPIAFGVLTSKKTVSGMANRYPKRYPLVANLADIFSAQDSRALNIVHYSADDDDGLIANLKAIVELAGPNCDGVQINMGDKDGAATSPSPYKVAKFAAQYPRMRIIVQVNARAPSVVVSRRVREYAYSATDVLLDGSYGNGCDFFSSASNTEHVKTLLNVLRSAYPHLGIGIAGGLSDETLPQVEHLFAGGVDLSTDAEGRLRDDNDHLSIGKAISYAARVGRMIRRSIT